MSQRRSFVTLTLNPEKEKLLLLNQKLNQNKCFILGANSMMKINW